MLLNGKRFEQLQEDDLLNLIGEKESNTLDFKLNAYFPSREDEKQMQPKAREEMKAEFCADLCSFANARGGWIICGMAEDQGEANDLCGLGPIDGDDLILRLKQIADSQIEPRIVGLDFREVGLQDTAKAKAIVIYIPRSLNKPHRVKLTKKFHIRRSRGKEEMELNELREAFNLSETLIERIRAFRHSRIEAIYTNNEEELPINLIDVANPTLILHILPLGFSEIGESVDLKKVTATPAVDNSFLQHLWNHMRFNSDGYLLPIPHFDKSNEWEGYIQVFRGGAIEAVRNVQWSDKNARKVTPLTKIESKCLEVLETSLAIQKHLDVAPPLVISATLINAKGVVLGQSHERLTVTQEPCKKNKILPPETIMENYGTPLPSVMKPIFDVFAQAGGLSGSQTYDENGNWTASRY